jgi:hypothetical protein
MKEHLKDTIIVLLVIILFLVLIQKCDTKKVGKVIDYQISKENEVNKKDLKDIMKKDGVYVKNANGFIKIKSKLDYDFQIQTVTVLDTIRDSTYVLDTIETHPFYVRKNYTGFVGDKWIMGYISANEDSIKGSFKAINETFITTTQKNARSPIMIETKNSNPYITTDSIISYRTRPKDQIFEIEPNFGVYFDVRTGKPIVGVGVGVGFDYKELGKRFKK